MSLLQDDSMRRQTWHILGWPGVRLGGWSFWRLDMPRQGGGVGTFCLGLFRFSLCETKAANP